MRRHCTKVSPYSETNVMHFLFSLLRIKCLYMFRALLVHPQEALHKQHLIYSVRVMSVGCNLDWRSTAILVQPTDITRTQYTKCRFCSTSWRWASNARNIYRLLPLNKLNKICITFVSLYWYTVVHGKPNIKPKSLSTVCPVSRER
jgi:hypothetical protein